MNPEPADIKTDESKFPARTSERQTSRWDIRNAPKNYVWLMAFQAGSSLFAFLAVWLITQNSGDAGYGAVLAVIAASQIAQIFVNWTTVAVVRFGVDEFVETGSIARTFWSRFVILIANLGLLLSTASLWFPLLADVFPIAGVFWLVIVHFSVTALWLHVQMGLQAAKMLRSQGLLQMLERLIIVVGVASLFFNQSLELRSAVICYIAGPLLMTVVGIVHLRAVIFTKFSIDAAIIKKTLVYSLPLLPYWFVGLLSGNYVDAAFVAKFLSTADLGVYGVAAQVNGIAMQIPTIANTILFPLLLTQQAESSSERTFFYFRHILPSAVLGWGLACSLLACAGYIFVPIVFKPEFVGASLPMWVLLASSVFWVPVAVGYAAYANAISATYMSLVASCFSAVVNISANFYLIPRYGMVGCSWATFAAYATAAAIFAILLNRGPSVPFSWIFLAFVPSVIGAITITYFEMPLWALIACFVSSSIIAFYRRLSFYELYKFVAGFWRTTDETS